MKQVAICCFEAEPDGERTKVSNTAIKLYWNLLGILSSAKSSLSFVTGVYNVQQLSI